MLKRGVFLIILACCSLCFGQSIPNAPSTSQTNTPAVAPANTPAITSINTKPAQTQTSPANTPNQQKATGGICNYIHDIWFGMTIDGRVATILAIAAIILPILGYMVVRLWSKFWNKPVSSLPVEDKPGTMEWSTYSDEMVDSGRDKANRGRGIACKSKDLKKLKEKSKQDCNYYRNEMVESIRRQHAIARLEGDYELQRTLAEDILKYIPNDPEALGIIKNIEQRKTQRQMKKRKGFAGVEMILSNIGLIYMAQLTVILIVSLLAAFGGITLFLFLRHKKKAFDNYEKLLNELIAEAQHKGKLKGEIGQLKNDLANAINRVKELEKGDRRDEAIAALEEISKSGDTTKLQAVLIADTNQHKDAIIEQNRKISAEAYLQGDIDTALAAVNTILQLLPDDLDALNRKGLICKLRGNLSEAVQCYEKALRLAKTQNNEQAQAAAYGNLGIVHWTRGELDKAVDMYNKALEINHRLGIEEGMANTYGNLGNVYRSRGELDKAVDMYNKALEINRRLERQDGMANQYGNLGIVYGIRGKLDKAEEMFYKALVINQRLGRQEGMANAYGNLGNIYQIRGDIDKTVEMYSKALEIHQRLGHQEGMAKQYTNLGIVYNIRGELDKALDMYKKAQEINQQLGLQEEMTSQPKIKTFEDLYAYFQKNEKHYLIERLPPQDGNPSIVVSLLSDKGKPLMAFKPKPTEHVQLSRYIFRGVEVSQPKLVIPKSTIEAIVQTLLLPPDIFGLRY